MQNVVSFCDYTAARMITLIITNTDYTDKQPAARMITPMKGRDYTDSSQMHKKMQDFENIFSSFWGLQGFTLFALVNF
jgi:hypothetical protein